MTRPRKYYLVAGEASGDLHGANLIRAMKALDPDAEYRCWGGDLMKEAGAELVSHYRDRAFMGLWEVISNLRTITRFLRQAAEDIRSWKPDALILIDNPGFNMRLAKMAREAGIPVHYYIAPKAWAWNEDRVKKLLRDTDHVYTILPFETEFFARRGLKVDYVGNPVVDAVSSFTPRPDWKKVHGIVKPVIALLPGSRRHEINSTLPMMASLQPAFPDYTFVVAGAPGYSAAQLRAVAGSDSIPVVENDTYHVLANAHAALVASGTATLETAAFGVPQVVCYRVSPLTWFVGKMVVKLKWVSLVNLITERELVKELLQHDFNEENLVRELNEILSGTGREAMLKGYGELNKRLGKPGASAQVAQLICTRTVLLKNPQSRFE